MLWEWDDAHAHDATMYTMLEAAHGLYVPLCRPETFWKLNEHRVIEQISIRAEEDPSCPCMAEAAAILERVESRQLYILCGEIQVPHDKVDSSVWRNVTEEEVAACQRHDSGVMLQLSDIAVHNLKIDYTK